jgi:hypothetical protein
MAFNISVSAQRERDTIHLEIEPFYDIPEDIDGCVCYFSSSIDNCRSGIYLFANDFAIYGCIKINGFTQLLDLVSSNIEDRTFIYSKSDTLVEIRIIDDITERDGTYYEVEIKVKNQFGSSNRILWGRCDC